MMSRITLNRDMYIHHGNDICKSLSGVFEQSEEITGGEISDRFQRFLAHLRQAIRDMTYEDRFIGFSTLRHRREGKADMSQSIHGLPVRA